MDTNASKTSQPFVRVAEVWVPKDDRLVLAGGDYGDADAFAEASKGESFAIGEGLPGTAWESKMPVVLKEFNSTNFKRLDSALAAGLSSAVAIPVFTETALKAVMVLFCGTGDAQMGAIEVWKESGGKIGLVSGFYGNATDFEKASLDVTFSYGQGLPGGVLAANIPVLKRDIARAGSFIRSGQAAAAGFKTGLGLPIPVPGHSPCILTLLSAPNTPIAHRFEIWDARPECVGASRQAMLIDGLCEREGALWGQQNPPVDPTMADAWKGPIGQVLGNGLPFAQRDGTGLPADYLSMFALPIYREGELAFIVACYA